MYRGRVILGDFIHLAVWCLDSSGTPGLPVSAPVALVYSDTALVAALKIPIKDRYGITAFFEYPLQLDSRFSTGHHRVQYQYAIGSTSYGEQDDFDIVASGQADGAGIAIYYYRRPTADFVLMQTDMGRIIRRRNPRLV